MFIVAQEFDINYKGKQVHSYGNSSFHAQVCLLKTFNLTFNVICEAEGRVGVFSSEYKEEATMSVQLARD